MGSEPPTFLPPEERHLWVRASSALGETLKNWWDGCHLLEGIRTARGVGKGNLWLEETPPPQRNHIILYLLRRRQWHPTPVLLPGKIPWTEESGRLQSMGSLRVEYDWVTSLSLFTFTHWRRKGQPTPVFLPGESQGRGSLVGCRLWGHTESDRTEAT